VNSRNGTAMMTAP